MPFSCGEHTSTSISDIVLARLPLASACRSVLLVVTIRSPMSVFPITPNGTLSGGVVLVMSSEVVEDREFLLAHDIMVGLCLYALPYRIGVCLEHCKDMRIDAPTLVVSNSLECLLNSSGSVVGHGRK